MQTIWRPRATILGPLFRPSLLSAPRFTRLPNNLIPKKLGAALQHQAIFSKKPSMPKSQPVTFRAEALIIRHWLRSGNNNNANNANALAASGNNNGSTVSSVAAVRPALHSLANKTNLPS